MRASGRAPRALLLAIETSTRSTGVALLRGDEPVAEGSRGVQQPRPWQRSPLHPARIAGTVQKDEIRSLVGRDRLGIR